METVSRSSPYYSRTDVQTSQLEGESERDREEERKSERRKKQHNESNEEINLSPVARTH